MNSGNEAKRQLINELHRSVRKNFKRRKVIMRGIDETWQADLVDMSTYARQNKGFHFILTVIDNFSKYAWAIPLKNKTADSVTDAMEKILKMKYGKEKNQTKCPKHLQTDDGTEFFNSKFKGLMKKYNINHYSVFTHIKCSICERWNRTLKTWLWKEFSMNGNYRWINIIDELCDFYNRRVHSTIKMRPIDVNKMNEKKLLEEVYNYDDHDDNSLQKLSYDKKFRVGDHVRISKYKHVFEKGFTANWTTETFTITKVQNTDPVTYLLKDSQNSPIKGGFYRYELQKAKDPELCLVEKVLRKRGNQSYVKWLGMDQKSWVKNKDII